jgi:uncharacterized HhH-GPD family protein
MPDRLYFTDSDEANALLAANPVALLIGFVLDQQVPVQWAFASPLELQRRLGTLDPAEIATTDPAKLDRIFREKPALHRYPGTMAERTLGLCEALTADYDGDASRIWRDAHDARDLEQRLLDLPGIGPMKVRSLLGILGNRFDIRLDGWEDVYPQHPTLGDVDSPEALVAYQDAKRAYKAAQRQTTT